MWMICHTNCTHLVRSGWLILLWMTGCVSGAAPADPLTPASTPQVIRFEVSDPAALAGDEMTVSWETAAVDPVTIEVWGFTSYSAPQIQQIARYTPLAPAGSQSIAMPSAPSAIYLIVNPSIQFDQAPNVSIGLHPTFDQPVVSRFVVKQTRALPGESLTAEWESDSVYPLTIKTFLIFVTPDRSWTEAAEQFDDLATAGSITVTVPDVPNLAGLSFELYYRNHDYMGYINSLMIEIHHPDE
jgi:hypothetical protein